MHVTLVLSMPEVRWLNLEYFFYKIYETFGGTFRGGSGNYGYVKDVSSRTTFSEWVLSFFSSTLSLVWILATIAAIILFCMVVYIKLRSYELDQEKKKKHEDHFIKPSPIIAEQKNPRWTHIENLFASSNSNDWRVAIIEADTMLDELIQSYRVPGENLGERLKNIDPKQFPTIQSAWEAHKVRNRIAHEGVNFKLSEREAQMTKKHFEFIFKNAGVI